MGNERGQRIKDAMAAAGLSQRDVQSTTGISQSTLSRIITGDRAPKAYELVSIASSLGTTAAYLTGQSDVATRVLCAARSTNGSSMVQMRERLLSFLELDDYLEDQGIARV